MDRAFQPALDDAFKVVEEGIMPSVSMMLETLIEAAVSGTPGVDAELYAAELRSMGNQMARITREIQTMCGPAHAMPAYEATAA